MTEDEIIETRQAMYVLSGTRPKNPPTASADLVAHGTIVFRASAYINHWEFEWFVQKVALRSNQDVDWYAGRDYTKYVVTSGNTRLVKKTIRSLLPELDTLIVKGGVMVLLNSEPKDRYQFVYRKPSNRDVETHRRINRSHG